MTRAEQDMVRGYRAGMRSGSVELPACHAGESPGFKHGWLNARDDVIGVPRERAETLRRRAGMISESSS